MKPIQQNDFVSLVGDLANFVQNERVAAFNEGVDEMTDVVRSWVQADGGEPHGDCIMDILTNHTTWQKEMREFKP